jgi:holo-[acyl-carrier protein] synthase
MILGIGNDLTDIRRIAAALERFGERFTHRVFTTAERARADRRDHARAASYAKRFAAKEACAKALGTGMRQGVAWRDMGVVNGASGQPGLVLTGGAAQRLQAITPSGRQAVIHVSLSDDFPWASAFVVISAESSPMSGSTGVADSTP